jgi:6-phosphofructokinase 1
VHFASSRGLDGSVAIRRTGDYSVDYFLTPLDTVARDTKPLPPEYLKGEHDIAESFRDYARPLIGTIPHFDRIIAPPVEIER